MCEYCKDRGLIEYWQYVDSVPYQKLCSCVCNNGQAYSGLFAPITKLCSVNFMEKINEEMSEVLLVEGQFLKVESRFNMVLKKKRKEGELAS